MIELTSFNLRTLTPYQIIPHLPTGIKNKIYILCVRKWWRNYIPLTAQVPSWYSRKIIIQDMIFQSQQDNIHFMHLPFNTLRENKDWIIGCQCKDCLSEYIITNLEKVKRYRLHHKYWDQFNLDFNENWTLTDNYNSMCGSKYDISITTKIKSGEPIRFK